LYVADKPQQLEEKGKKVLRNVMKIFNSITYILMDESRRREVFDQIS
jgi:hypothetical protein